MNLFLLNIYLSPKQKYLSLSLLVLMSLFKVEMKAQVSTYTFAQSTGTFTEITGGTILATATGNAIGNPSIDDMNFTLTGFPFTFTFNGVGYTGCTVNSNGYITFGATAPATNLYTPISGTTAYAGAIAAWGGDMNAIFNLGTRTGQLRWEAVGTAPNQEIVIQWKNFRPAYSTITTNAAYLNFQIRLQQNGNKVVVIHGLSGMAIGATNISTTKQIGLRGAANTDFNNRANTTAQLFGASTAGTANTSVQSFSSVTATPGRPANGLSYTWTPPAPPACAVPTAITATSVTSTSATLNWTAASPAPSSGYQWEVRSSGAAGSGATGLVASGTTAAGVVTANATGLTANTTYSIYVRSNCGGSGFSAWTSAVTFFTGYCTASATNTSFEKISNVTFNTINNTSSSTAGYEDFTGVNTTVSTGSPYTFTATISGGFSADQILVWVDWNNDLDFVDVGEAVYTSAQGVGPHSTSITIPSGASAGNKRMRVRLHDSSDGPNSTPCGTSTYGQVEDYTLVVVTAVPCSGTPVAGTAASNPTNLCSAGSVALSLTGYSTGVSGITFQWQSSPNNSTWTDISGATTASYTVASVSAMTYFRCVVTCANGGATANSNSVQVTFGTPLGATFASPIAVGTLGCTAYTSTLSNVTTNCYGNDLAVGTNQSSDDIFYQFVLSNANNFPTIVNMGHCGTTFDTYIHLLSTTGALIVENDDNGTVCGGTAGSLQQTLAVGTYHLVSEGYGAATGNIITTISIPAPTGTGTITGTAITCASTVGLIYTVSGYTGATGYVWTVPSGATITAGQGTTSITVTMGATSGNVTCTPYNGACAGTATSYAVTVNTLSTAPTSITGTTTICVGASTTLTTNGGTLGTEAENVWYSGACGTDAFTQEWSANQPYSAPSTTLNSQTGGVINVTSTSNDPMIEMAALGSFNPSTYKYINIRYRVTAGAAGTAEIFFYNTTHNFAVGGESVAGTLISDNTWRVLSIDMSVDPDYTTGGNILGWRFDWAAASGVTMDIDFISLSDQPMIGEGNTITVSPTVTTTYYTAKKGACNTTGCASVTVTVNTLSIAPTSITGTTTICNGASTTLSVTGGTMGTGAIVEWFTGSCGGTSAGTGASINVSPTTTTTYYARYAGTCNTTSCASVTVTVNTLSIAPTGITGTTTICDGASTTLSVAGGTMGTGAIVEWFTGSCGGTSAGTGASINVSPTTTTTYYARYAGTCNTTSCASVTVTVNTLSIAPTSITGTTTICEGSSTTLSVAGGTMGTGAIVEWFTGSCGGTSAGTGASINVSPTTTTTYYARYAGTCNTTSCASVTVTVSTLSIAPTSITGTTTICNGASTTLTVTGGSMGTGAIVEWFTGSCGGTSAGTGASISVSPTTTTTYYARYAGTCNTTSCASVTVTVNTLSIAPTSITGTTTICNGSSTTLSVTGGTMGTGAVVEWFTGSCGGTSAGTGASINVSPTTTTTYYARYAGTCNTTSCASVIVNVMIAPVLSSSFVSPLCNGNANGSIDLTVTGLTPSLTFDGNINEASWGSALATSSGGAAPGFGAGHEVNALYATADETYSYFAIAGNVQFTNRILLFLDTKAGGYNTGNFDRTAAPDGINNFNSGTTFDAGFNADYCLVIGTNGSGTYYYDLFTLATTGSNNFLGVNGAAGLGASPANSNMAQGFEVRIPNTALGYVGGGIKAFAAYISDGGFLSNQFLTKANTGEGNYGSGVVTFGAAAPNPLTTPNLTYAWSNSATTQDIANIIAGTYTVTVTSANGCTANTSVIVTQPTALTGNSCVTTSDLCQAGTGAVKVVASGGTPPYTVARTPALGTFSPSNSIGTSGGNTLIINLTGGTVLNIVITDANGCQTP